METTDQFVFTTPRGKQDSRKINYLIDVRDFIGTPGHALLILAANRHLSVDVLNLYLWDEWEIERSRAWVYRRRWLFEAPNAHVYPSPQDRRAIAIMKAYPTLSLGQLSRLLAKHGIRRSREWVRRHRCDE
ncbi:MAG TPA: hypothetical protein VMI10_12340 [Terriglobales bacterium]|nr:hypothetical protein [Terriglobales bacterium]